MDELLASRWRLGRVARGCALWFVLVAACSGPVAAVPDAPTDASTLDSPPEPLAQRAYIKASNAGTGDEFGNNVALSADGRTLAVSAWLEASATATINGDQSDNSALEAGAVYVFVRTGATWTQQAYIKPSGERRDLLFGYTIALSSDGNTLAVTAPNDSSASTGIGGDPADTSAESAGAVYVFARAGTSWSQQAYVKASNAEAGDNFSRCLALSSDGSTLAVGAPNEDSGATGINGDQQDNSAAESGALYVFTRHLTSWSQQAYVKASSVAAGNQFGDSCAISGDGETLVVGASTMRVHVGTGYVFRRTESTWLQQASIQPPNSDCTYFVPRAVSTDGNELFGSCLDEVAILARTGISWSLEATLVPPMPWPWGVSGDGSTIVFAGDGSDGVRGLRYRRTGMTWTMDATIAAPVAHGWPEDPVWSSPALSADAAVLAVGDVTDASNGTGIDGSSADNSAAESGAVFVFE